ncbi:MAG: hypothetical protein OEL88_01895 [Sterolibacteriaceae bacterium MAG5]|nr:hypothetical protein [Candidatus Nitricoxidireducens bremensis]
MVPVNLAGVGLQVYGADATQSPKNVPLEDGRWRFAPEPSAKGGHYWMQAAEVRGAETRTATTAWSFGTQGKSPAAMLAQAKGSLDIVPLRIPEHGGFREGTAWEFGVRYEGQPLPGAVLHLHTENGTRTRVVADAEGVAKVLFPRDFDPASFDKVAGADRTRRGFVLMTELEPEGRKFVTAFNHFYYPDTMRGRNLWAGAGLFVIGMLCAAPLLRHRERNNA